MSILKKKKAKPKSVNLAQFVFQTQITYLLKKNPGFTYPLLEKDD